MKWFAQRWGARRYRHMVGADLPLRERRRRVLSTRADAPVVTRHTLHLRHVERLPFLVEGFDENEDPS